ncbi:MAG TPA: hypothetical protein VG324_14525 [Blastocatellia bacterium]|nr:hypothetical protein [Blastocatellia bacterium]
MPELSPAEALLSDTNLKLVIGGERRRAYSGFRSGATLFRKQDGTPILRTLTDLN